jgi:hypothetical protein
MGDKRSWTAICGWQGRSGLRAQFTEEKDDFSKERLRAFVNYVQLNT